METQVTREQVVNKLIDVVIDAVNLQHMDRSKIHTETPLMEKGLELDSVDMLEVVVAVEHQFNIKVEGAEEGKQYFRTIGTIADFVESKTKKPVT